MHEDLLRHIWSRQMFDPSRLSTTDGAPLRILEPGTLSHRSGPDFRNARIEIGGTVYSGDIEFHRNCSDWDLHNHQHDKNYNAVILHVVLQGEPKEALTESGRIIPAVILEPFLSIPIAAIGDQLSREEYATRHRRIPCFHSNDAVTSDLLTDWIRTLYRERLREKSGRMRERLDAIIIGLQRTIGEPGEEYTPFIDDFPEQTGPHGLDHYQRRLAWEQLLYEELMDCLGYSNNRIPMKQLAERMPLQQIHASLNGLTPAPIHIEALLFRASGLLPSIEDVSDMDSKVHIHSLTAVWREMVQVPLVPPLHPTEWNFSPTRPANFPTIRIAAASVLVYAIIHRSLFRSLVTVIGGRFSSAREKTAQIALLLDAGEHPFWNDHYAFSETSRQRHSILGASRINDMIVNTVIPFIILYASVFRNEQLAEQCLNIAAELPLLEDNAVLRTMRSQLIKATMPLTFAYQQQGLIQLYRRYCSADRCSECRVGKAIEDR